MVKLHRLTACINVVLYRNIMNLLCVEAMDASVLAAHCHVAGKTYTVCYKVVWRLALMIVGQHL